MRVNSTLPEVCDRTRQNVSLRLDTELSEFEEALLASHLRRCASCTTFAEDLEVITETLRTAAASEPAVRFQVPRRPARIGVPLRPVRLGRPYRPTRIRVARMLAAATTAVTAAVVVGGVFSLQAPETQIGALEIQTARERMSAKEEMLEQLDSTQLDSTGPRRAQDIPAGLQAAERMTADRSVGAG